MRVGLSALVRGAGGGEHLPLLCLKPDLVNACSFCEQVSPAVDVGREVASVYVPGEEDALALKPFDLTSQLRAP